MEIVRKAIVDAGQDLKGALGVAWPGGNGRMIHEKNATAYFAFRLRESGFITFFEPALVRSKSRGRQPLESLDLLALHPGKGIVLVAESKSLYAPKYIDGLSRDIRRMKGYLAKYKPATYDINPFQIKARIGVSLAITDQERFKNWWVDGQPSVTRDPKKTAGFHRALKKQQATTETVVLLDKTKSENKDEWSLLGALWTVAGN